MRPVRTAALLLLAILLVFAGVFYVRPVAVLEDWATLKLRAKGASSDFAETPHGRIHYFEMQAPGGGGAPLVLVHGLGGKALNYSAMMPRFADAGFHVYALDLLGYGGSPKPDADYSIALQSKVVEEFLDAMKLQRVNLLGWSMGGWITLNVALDAPGRIERAVVYDSAGLTFVPTFGRELFTPRNDEGFRVLVRALSPTMKVPPANAQRELIRSYKQNGWVVQRGVDSMETGKSLLDARLAQMQPPLLIVWGTKDVLTPLSLGIAMHTLDPRSVLATVEGCGHMAPLECAPPMVRETIDFLRAQPPMVGGELQLRQ